MLFDNRFTRRWIAKLVARYPWLRWVFPLAVAFLLFAVAGTTLDGGVVQDETERVPAAALFAGGGIAMMVVGARSWVRLNRS